MILQSVLDFSSVPESLQYALLGMAIVFFVLIALLIMMKVLRVVIDTLVKPESSEEKNDAAHIASLIAAATSAAPPAAAPAYAGEVKLNTVDDKTAALLLAIIAQETEIALTELKVKSIRDKSAHVTAGSFELNKKYAYKIGKEFSEVMKYNITINEKVYEVEVEQGAAEIVNVAAASASPAAVAAPLSPAPAPAVSAPAAPAVSAPAVSSAGGTTISSPLPGSVLSIPVKVGDAVKAGQIVALIEAMKMENEIPAPADGTVSQILVTQGASINTGDALIVLA